MKKIFVLVSIGFLVSCSQKMFNPKWTKQTSPPAYIARFETSKGNFDIEVTRAWSPQAADRLYQLLNHHFYDNVLFYRVVPNFVVQWGNIDTTIIRNWEKFKVHDEPVIKGNLKGTVSFARSGKDTRGNDLFINLKDNPKLDTVNYEKVTGFPAFGTVIKGMDVVASMYPGYGNKTMDVYDSLSSNRQQYLAMFPKLDSIKRAYIVNPD
jgi:cyclophilin family peptidyl-prolyl cis-trans isomerase